MHAISCAFVDGLGFGPILYTIRRSAGKCTLCGNTYLWTCVVGQQRGVGAGASGRPEPWPRFVQWCLIRGPEKSLYVKGWRTTEGGREGESRPPTCNGVPHAANPEVCQSDAISFSNFL